MMNNAEKMIRRDINELDDYRLAPRVSEIRRDIKYAFWHEFINENLYNELMELVSEKYNSIF